MTQYKEGLISCICLTYNHAHYVGKCIESIWEQEYTQIEILALDDGSTDESASILQSYAERSPIPMHVFTQGNSGNIAKNFNTLVQKAQGEYITILSTDDYFKPDAFSSKIPFFEEDKNMCFVGNLTTEKVDENHKTTAPFSSFIDWSCQRHETIDDLTETLYQSLATIPLQGTLFKTQHVHAIKGFDEDLLGDDLILFTKIFSYMKGKPELRFKLLEKVAIYYREHSSNLSKDRGRAIPMYVEWKQRYFPNRETPLRLFETFRCGIEEALTNEDQEQLQHIFELLSSALKNDSTDHRIQFVNLIFSPSTNKRMYFLPFLFELKTKKDCFSSRISLTILGFKLLERIVKNNGSTQFVQLKFCKFSIYKKFKDTPNNSKP